MRSTSVLLAFEGRLLRLAEGHGIDRNDFLKHYLGYELDPLWLNRVSKLSPKSWKNFVARDKDRIKELRGEIHALATGLGLEIGEFREIVHMVQRGRARSAPSQERDGGGEPAPRYFNREEIPQPRPAVPRSDSGRQHRPDKGGR